MFYSLQRYITVVTKFGNLHFKKCILFFKEYDMFDPHNREQLLLRSTLLTGWSL